MPHYRLECQFDGESWTPLNNYRKLSLEKAQFLLKLGEFFNETHASLATHPMRIVEDHD
jgi:hypothetical protein